MAKYKQESLEQLKTCHPLLQILFSVVINYFENVILCGHRDEKEQDSESAHNKQPSLAVDAIPCPVDWQNTNKMYTFGGMVKGIAIMLGIPIRWGGDWEDGTIDLPHFELAEGYKNVEKELTAKYRHILRRFEENKKTPGFGGGYGE